MDTYRDKELSVSLCVFVQASLHRNNKRYFVTTGLGETFNAGYTVSSYGILYSKAVELNLALPNSPLIAILIEK
jgi:hypothetical protein